ncbi:MAG: hypothetical protein U1E27_08850, partial [Kiritimatiellia bacterium]|nr:hypothetical protein [Kiritimatiellia bacterium]
MKSLPASLIAALVFCAGQGLAQDRAELELDHRVESEYVTPHTAWAKPYALGSIRVLFFVSGRGMEPRQVMELRQRFDIEAEMIFWTRIIDSTKEHWHGGDLGVERMDRLLSQKWDAFVFLDIPVTRLSSDQQVKLLQSVVNGAGLMLVGGDDPRVLKEKNKLATEPALSLPGTRYRIGQGRGLRIDKQPDIPYRPGWEVDYDVWAGQMGRGLLWAAGKAEPLVLTFQPDSLTVPRALLPGKSAVLHWHAPAGVHELTLEMNLRRSDGVGVSLPPVAVSGGSGAVPVSLPVLRQDVYTLDV